jgi:hypothetical protein
MRFRPVLFGVMVTVTCGGFFACGSRTALPGDFDAVGSGNDDSGGDARKPRDAGPDTAIPPIDANVPHDASRLDCPDAGATLIYLITSDNQLLSFYPPSAAFTLIGNIACPIPDPTDTMNTPFSMAVDRKGTAYVEFYRGQIFKVSTLTAACAATPFVIGQDNFNTFGMGFSTNGGGPSETLYIAGGTLGAAGSTPPNTDLGSIDVTDYQVTDIAPFNPFISDVELTGTGDGRLFAFWSQDQTSDTNISEINKATGDVIGSDDLPGTALGNGWAFGYWGGDFYTFTGMGSSTVTQFDPSTKAQATIATYSSEIVGAGVSTCAPQQ